MALQEFGAGLFALDVLSQRTDASRVCLFPLERAAVLWCIYSACVWGGGGGDAQKSIQIERRSSLSVLVNRMRSAGSHRDGTLFNWYS